MRKREVHTDFRPAEAPGEQHEASFYAAFADGYEGAPMDAPQTTRNVAGSHEVHWKATEESSPRTFMWYVVLTIVELAVTALVALLTRDAISSATVLLAFILLAALMGRKPVGQRYSIKDGQLMVGRKLYALHRFKAFSVDEQSRHLQLILIPLQRFMPVLSVPISDAVIDKAIDILAETLPLQPYRPDLVDRLLRRLRL